MKFGHLVSQCPDGPWSPEVTKRNAAKWRETMRENAKANLANATEEEQQLELHAIREWIASGFEDDHPLDSPEDSDSEPNNSTPHQADIPEATHEVAEEEPED